MRRSNNSKLPQRRQRDNNEDDGFDRRRTQSSHSIDPNRLKQLKIEFNKNTSNLKSQSALCTAGLSSSTEVRGYMQSIDKHFSHTLDPKLVITNQGLSGRCWMFSTLNVMRHELIRQLDLPLDFELSECYLSFYEKLEKCNHVLTQFMEKNEINQHDLNVRHYLVSGYEDGGFWATGLNLIEKYGIIPKTCFQESVNSFDTDDMDTILGQKINEFALKLVNEPDHQKRFPMKEEMMETIFNILAKLLGTPPSVDEKIEWSFILRLEIDEQLKRVNKRKQNGGKHETLNIKHTEHITPLEFYQKFITHKLTEYMSFCNDPRNAYNKYYQSATTDFIVEGERSGYYNLDMDEISQLCIASIIDNTPVQFDCDVQQYLHSDHELLDNKCFDYELWFDTKFNTLNKRERLETFNSGPTHAMVLVGVDLDENSKPLKWKVENSWGRDHMAAIVNNNDDSGYYTMSHDWFKEFVFGVIIHKNYIKKALYNKYNKAKTNPVTLHKNDIMA